MLPPKSPWIRKVRLSFRLADLLVCCHVILVLVPEIHYLQKFLRCFKCSQQEVGWISFEKSPAFGMMQICLSRGSERGANSRSKINEIFMKYSSKIWFFSSASFLLFSLQDPKFPLISSPINKKFLFAFLLNPIYSLRGLRFPSQLFLRLMASSLLFLSGKRVRWRSHVLCFRRRFECFLIVINFVFSGHFSQIILISGHCHGFPHVKKGGAVSTKSGEFLENVWKRRRR